MLVNTVFDLKQRICTEATTVTHYFVSDRVVLIRAVLLIRVVLKRVVLKRVVLLKIEVEFKGKKYE